MWLRLLIWFTQKITPNNNGAIRKRFAEQLVVHSRYHTIERKDCDSEQTSEPDICGTDFLCASILLLIPFRTVDVSVSTSRFQLKLLPLSLFNLKVF